MSQDRVSLGEGEEGRKGRELRSNGPLMETQREKMGICCSKTTRWDQVWQAVLGSCSKQKRFEDGKVLIFLPSQQMSHSSEGTLILIISDPPAMLYLSGSQVLKLLTKNKSTAILQMGKLEAQGGEITFLRVTHNVNGRGGTIPHN